jgi:hypothetical protein
MEADLRADEASAADWNEQEAIMELIRVRQAVPLHDQLLPLSLSRLYKLPGASILDPARNA